MSEAKIYLLLGSNLGDRKALIEKAISSLNEKAGIIVQKSAFYETAPWGDSDQPDFLNQVVLLKSTLSALHLLKLTQHIEIELGRIRELKWGPRVIDIDILFYGNEIIRHPELIVPHPRLHERRFTLLPLNEIASHFEHPVLKKKVSTLLSELQDELFVKKLS